MDTPPFYEAGSYRIDPFLEEDPIFYFITVDNTHKNSNSNISNKNFIQKDIAHWK